MSRRAEIRFDWAGEERLFRLPIGQLAELQEACDAGPLAIMRRLENGGWRYQDVRETLRLGLVGGGMKDVPATKLVKRYVDAAPLGDNVPAARLVLAAAVLGVEDEPLAGAEPENAGGKGPAPESGSASATSTPQEPSSAGAPTSSTA